MLTCVSVPCVGDNSLEDLLQLSSIKFLFKKFLVIFQKFLLSPLPLKLVHYLFVSLSLVSLHATTLSNTHTHSLYFFLSMSHSLTCTHTHTLCLTLCYMHTHTLPVTRTHTLFVLTHPLEKNNRNWLLRKNESCVPIFLVGGNRVGECGFDQIVRFQVTLV